MRALRTQASSAAMSSMRPPSSLSLSLPTSPLRFVLPDAASLVSSNVGLSLFSSLTGSLLRLLWVPEAGGGGGGSLAAARSLSSLPSGLREVEGPALACTALFSLSSRVVTSSLGWCFLLNPKRMFDETRSSFFFVSLLDEALGADETIAPERPKDPPRLRPPLGLSNLDLYSYDKTLRASALGW